MVVDADAVKAFVQCVAEVILEHDGPSESSTIRKRGRRGGEQKRARWWAAKRQRDA